MTLQNIILKQLAFENANEECQSMLRPIRETNSLMEYLKACRDIRYMSHRAKLVALETFMYKKLLMPNILTVGSPTIWKNNATYQHRSEKIILLLIRRNPQEYVQDVKRGSTGWMNVILNLIRMETPWTPVHNKNNRETNKGAIL